MGVKPLFKKKKSLNAANVAIVVLVVIIGVLGYLVYSKYQKLPPDMRPKQFPPIVPGGVIFKDKETGQEKDRLNILVMGLDEGRNEKGIIHHKGSRTDTIFVLSVDKEADRVSMLSIPRDTWIHISDKHGENKINSAYGEAFWDEYDANNHNYEQAMKVGISEARKTVERFLEVSIDHHVIIKIEAAKEMVDALGGIEIDVEKNMDYDDNWGNLHIHLKKGKQRLNGTQAVGYARFRHDEEGDWGRMRRQQQLIRALITELKKPEHLGDIEALGHVISKNLITDLNLDQIIDLARVYKKDEFTQDKLVKGTVIGEDQVINGTMVILPDKKTKERLVARLLMDPSFVEIQDQNIRVLNGCGAPGLGSRTADKLKEQGYSIVEVSNCPEETPREVTEIIDHYGNPGGFQRLEEGLGIKGAKHSRGQLKDTTTTLDFTVILGKDILPQATTSPGPGQTDAGDTK